MATIMKYLFEFTVIFVEFAASLVVEDWRQARTRRSREDELDRYK